MGLIYLGTSAFTANGRQSAFYSASSRLAKATLNSTPLYHCEEVAYYNMILVETLVELLVEKGLLESDEIKERLKRVKAETTLDFKRKQ